MCVSQHGASEPLGAGVRSVQEENRRVAFWRRKPFTGWPDDVSLHASPGKFHEPFPYHLATGGFRLMIRSASGERKG